MELEKENDPVSVTLIHPGRIDTPYNEHAHSYLDKQPTHIGMMYAPETVAEAILYAAEHPKRDMYVGSQAKLLAMLGTLVPRFIDKFMEKTMYFTQHDERPSNPQESSSLYKAGYGMHERGTNKGWTRETSYYVKASKHPLITSAIVAGLSACLLAACRSK